MSGGAFVPSGVEPHTNEVHIRTTPMHTLQVVIDPTPLEILTHKHRACTGRITFNSLSLDVETYLHERVVIVALNSSRVLSYIMAADIVEKKIVCGSNLATVKRLKIPFRIACRLQKGLKMMLGELLLWSLML
jgi:hypothetical protein